MWFFPHSCGHCHLCMSMVLPKCIWLKPHVMVISTHVAFLPQWFIHGNNQTYVEMLEFCLVGLGSPVKPLRIYFPNLWLNIFQS